MQLLLVSVFLVICGSVLVSTSDPHYVIVLPTLLKERSQEKVCVTIQDLNCDFHLKLELQQGDHVQEIATEDIKPNDFSRCYTFQVPAVEKDKTEWAFHVSGKGEHFKIDETKKVYIAKSHNSCIIQTDKSTYKPGDIVKIRLVSIDHNFHAADEKFEKIFLLDPNGNHIGQWLDVTPNHGMVDLHYHLAKELKLGYYKFKIPDKCEGSFTVAEYVSKRFEVHINLPTVSSTTKKFILKVCGSYTYGKPVQGTLDVEICHDENHNIHPWYVERYQYIDDDDDDDHHDEHDSDKCIEINDAKTDSTGCLLKEIDLSFFKLSTDERYHKLQIETSLTEDGTGHREEAKAELPIINHEKLSFEGTGMLYQKGVPFTGKIKAINAENQPMANTKVVIVSIESFADNTKLASLETDQDGVAHFTLNTDSWTDEMGLAVLLEGFDLASIWETHSSSQGFLWIHPYFSESHSMLKLETIREPLSSGSDMSVHLDYHINKDQLDSKTDHISFFYYIITESGIQSHEEHKVDIPEQSSGSTLHGSISLKVPLHEDLAPYFIMLVYAILPQGETISSAGHYEVLPGFDKKVGLKFSEEKVHPGGKVNLEVSAEPGSLCSVRSVDKGYLLQYPHDDTSFASKAYQSISRPLGQVRYLEEQETQCPENQTSVSSWRRVLDTSHLFQESNLRLITNTRARMPVKCEADEVAPRLSTIKKKVSHKGKEEESRLGSPRKNFPDTWLFELVPVGPEGHTVLNLDTPDTITKWETDAMCLGKSGFAETRKVGLLTFQSYFVDLMLPDSAVQGEKFKINAQIFTYDTKCILVAATIDDVDGINVVQDKEQSRCVCNQQANHFSWDAIASKLGQISVHVLSGSVEIEGECKEDAQLVAKELRIDSVVKNLTVKARGNEEQKTDTHLIYARDSTQKIGVYLRTPERLVPGTERAHIIVVGDIMANVVVNLENILPLPDGCAEQSVSKLSRYCYSLEYLQSSNELTPETKEQFLEHIIEGYQKQLTFKRDNGGYGFFSGEPSNVWITALVVRAFSCIQQFIHVDEKHFEEAIHLLESRQLPSGCFNGTKEYFYYEDDEDEDDIIQQTALVVISVLEHKLPHTESIVEKALSYLKKKAETTKAKESLAVLVYTFTLSGDSELRELMLKRLDDLADKDSESKHWVNTIYGSGDIETTSYVILAHLSDKIITQKDLEESAQSIRWLASQQNPWGGFFSSQDTTIALQAFAKYAKATAHQKGTSVVTIENDSGFHKELQIDQKNSFLVQTVDLPTIPGGYSVSVKGNGCVYLQSHLHYNSIPDEQDVHFEVNVTTNPTICTRYAQKKFDVHIATRYIGKRAKTNMALIEVELLSGFVPCKKSIKKLRKHSDVKRVDVLPGKIDIYLEELNHDIDYFTLTLIQDTHVDNLQPAHVTVLDYYVPDHHDHASYNHPCTKTHCSVLASERKDCGNPTITKEDCEKKGCCYDTSIPETKWCFFHETKLIEPEDQYPPRPSVKEAH